MIGLSIVVGAVSLGSSYRTHRTLNPLLMMMSGAVVLVFYVIGPESHSALAETLHPYLGGLGGMMILFAHRVNMRLCASCRSCAHEHANDRDPAPRVSSSRSDAV
jgi:hypothetical protein